MREFELTIDEALRKGLGPERSIPLNSQWLFKALGFRCGREGLEPAISGTNPLPNTVDMYYNWPFPQFVVGERYNFLIIRDSISAEDIVYVISDDMNTVTHVFTVDALTFGTGGLMEVADFGEYAIMMNGVVMIYWNVGGAWNASLATATIPLMNTICNFKGQAVGGGITTVWHDCDETFYCWTKIGELDFTPDIRNTAGYRRCPYGGEVYNVKRLGDSVIGYSSKGITALFPTSSPVATFGFKELVNIGTHNKGAINGSLYRHIFVGEDLVVREVTKEGVKELGYSVWMDELDNEDIIVSYDRSKDDFYIGNSKRTFLLSPYGMTEVLQHPSCVWRIDPDNVYMLPDTEDDDLPLITSEAFNMGYSGQKTTSVIETDALLGTSPQAGVDYMFDMSTWGSTPFVSINNEGAATIRAAGNQLRASVRFASLYAPFRIGYIKVRYKMTDLRSIRGVYAPPPRGQ